ncbi:hypothetical protein QCA50_009896 [Cerrena zonata]|uniref:Uncharacterized protein n=1 Tax=Cerrena zonata TaxID=2478898 RepID=A0AAW0GB32_9APHY
MPLITSEEFDLITGDLPLKLKSSSSSSTSKDSAANKLKSNMNIKHQIFQSPLYDKTSGSDTNGNISFTSMSNGNASDSGGSSTTTPAKRRPGRRAGTNSNSNSNDKDDDPDKQHTEAALLAKIMKQFSGPAAAKNDELNEDLNMMGVKTRWPVDQLGKAA